MFLTLNKIREHKPCLIGYNNLVYAMLDKPAFYTKFKAVSKERKNEHLSMKFVLESVGLGDAIWTLRCFDLQQNSTNEYVVKLMKLSYSHFSHVLNENDKKYLISVINTIDNYTNGFATISDLRASVDILLRLYDECECDESTENLYAFCINACAMLSSTHTQHSIRCLNNAILNSGKKQNVDLTDKLNEMFLEFCDNWEEK